MTMSTHPSPSQADDADKTCDKCGAPASWADDMNLSYPDSIQHHLYTWLVSPRMWPIGYIVGSPFSPLQLEREIPERNWRDAFEDLVALETCGQMISHESRKKEAEVAARLLRQEAYDAVSQINEMLESDSKYVSILQIMRKLAARRENVGWVSQIDKAALRKRMRSQQLIDKGQDIICKLKELEQDNWAKHSSRSKPRGHWISSLVSSGALPGWESRLFDSANGICWSFNKKVASYESSDHVRDEDNLLITEHELSSRFEWGLPLQVGHPVWSTQSGGYPEFEYIPTVDPDDGSIIGYTEFKVPPLRHSICSQFTGTNRTKLTNGLFSTKVLIRNQFTDDRTEEKEIVDDTGKVLEEVKKAFIAMRDRKHGFELAWGDKRNEDAEAIITEQEMYEEDE